MKKYNFILGANSSIFYDPGTGLNVVSKDPKNPTVYEGKISKRISQALKHGHIREAEDVLPEDDDKTALTPKAIADMTDAELLDYYKENFEVTASDVKDFKKLPIEEKRALLTQE